MQEVQNKYLIAAALLTGAAALIHLGCIFGGAPWYRFLGAGEPMAQLDLAGHWYPKAMASVIAAILSVWSLYALSGAGIIRKLPFVRLVLIGITGVFLIRGLAFVPLQPYFPGNSMTFWLVSSSICLRLLYALGLRQVWSEL